MNKKYHIHVYKTDVKGEIDVERTIKLCLENREMYFWEWD